MRPLTAAVLGAALAATTAVPASAHPTTTLAPTSPVDVTHARTGNIDYLGRFPEHAGTAGGRLVGDVFFVTDPRGVFAYDVSTPEDPTLLGSLPLPQSSTGVALAQEDPDTDGNILLVDAASAEDPLGHLHVVDVSNPAAMSVLGTADVYDHTWTCVSTGPAGKAVGHHRDRADKPGKGVPDHAKGNGCAFAYGRTGWIVDLRDPTAPVVLEEGWRHATGFGGAHSNSPYTHDLTEIRPGLVMSAGEQNVLMDTSDPAHPVLLNIFGDDEFGDGERFSSLGYHSVEWAQDGHAPTVVFGTEIAPSGPTNTAGSDCEGENSVIETWDASAILAALDQYEDTGEPSAVLAARFTPLDTFDAGGRGAFVEGQAPGHVLYCAHWMEPHPDFDDGGLLAISYYDRGTRFVQVDDAGKMTEVGWITPAEGYSGSVQWIGSSADGGDVAYIMDYRRGLEVVELHPGRDATVVHQTADVIAAGAAVTPLAADGGIPTSSLVAAGLGLALVGVEIVRRRRETAQPA